MYSKVKFFSSVEYEYDDFEYFEETINNFLAEDVEELIKIEFKVDNNNNYLVMIVYNGYDD